MAHTIEYFNFGTLNKHLHDRNNKYFDIIKPTVDNLAKAGINLDMLHGRAYSTTEDHKRSYSHEHYLRMMQTDLQARSLYFLCTPPHPRQDALCLCTLRTRTLGKMLCVCVPPRALA